MVLTFLNGCLECELVGGAVSLVSSLDRATCPSCDEPGCVCDCDGSQGADDANLEEEFDAVARQRYNAGVDTVESFVVALVAEGVLTVSECPEVNKAIQSCLDALGDKFLG